jgi:hypothetical protein
MASELRPPVWAKLFVDEDDSYDAFRIKVTSEIQIVDDLKEAIAKKCDFAAAAALDVYSPGTDVPVPDSARSLRPDILLSSSDFPSETTYQNPLVVVAMTRRRQTKRVRTHTWPWYGRLWGPLSFAS